MSSSRKRRVNNHDVCDQKQRFSKCFLSLGMTRSLTRGIRHFPLIINLLVDRRSKKNKALHCPYNVQEHPANEATGKTPYAAPAAGGRDEYSKLLTPTGPHFTIDITEYLHITEQLIVYLDNKVEGPPLGPSWPVIG
jgi:hypothetical protein